MRIGFEAKKAVKNFTGIGNYSRRIIQCVVDDYTADDVYLFYSAKENPEAMSLLKDVHKVRPKGLLSAKAFAELWRCFLSHNDIKRAKIDVYHGLSNELPFDIKKANCKTVVTIHDLIFLRFPETYSWSARLVLKVKTRFACKVADKIVAVSEMTKRDLMHFYNVQEEKIQVIYQSIDSVYSKHLSDAELKETKSKLHLPDHYVLCVGTIQERKNQNILVKALPLLPDDMYVVIVGKRTPYQDLIVKTAEVNGTLDRLMIINDASNEMLPAIYQNATVFACLSRFEGFGIPLAEALASGIPVIGATGSCLEEAGGTGSIYLDPDDVEGLAESVKKIVGDDALRQTMTDKGQDWVKKFSDEWQGKQIKALYESL